jgi:hypothetical protein
MRLDYQRQIIGKFVRDGCELEWWTRYTPPLKVGPVEQRYLKVRDRSVPNSMGIYFRLFHHPFLAVSVIYHEQLHYGGPGGNPGQGIENETETLLRETIFARGLMAKIAPSADSEIPGFERSLVQQARGLRLEHMLAQLIAPVEDVDYLEPLNDSVEKAYGEQLTPAQAKRKSDINLEERNLKIHIENVTQTWCPEVEFPKLGTAAASTVTSRYRKVLFDRWTRSNRLSAADHARIFKDRHCAPWLRAWSEYCQRPGATTELAQASGHGIDWLNHLLGDGLSAEIESPSPDSLAPEFLAMLEQIQQQRGLSADHDDDE